MKQLSALVLLFLLAPAIFASAQETSIAKSKDQEHLQTTGAEPRVWISNIPSYNTTRAELLANPFLITDSVGCKVSGFTLSLQAPGHDFYGPLYVNGNEFSEVQKETIKKWDYENVTLFVQDIHLNCHESDARSSALKYYFSH
jgi:hypothetical protein